MKLTLGFSPCPNDTFIFDALVNNKIDTVGITFEVALEDVQTLNNWAIADKLAITKLSYGVLPLVLDKYIVLNSGSALGKTARRREGHLAIGRYKSTIMPLRVIRAGVADRLAHRVGRIV